MLSFPDKYVQYKAQICDTLWCVRFRKTKAVALRYVVILALALMTVILCSSNGYDGTDVPLDANHTLGTSLQTAGSPHLGSAA